MQEFGYRQRIRLHVDSRAHALGYHRKNSHRVVDIAACLIADPLLNTVLARLRQESRIYHAYAAGGGDFASERRGRRQG